MWKMPFMQSVIAVFLFITVCWQVFGSSTAYVKKVESFSQEEDACNLKKIPPMMSPSG